MKFRTKLFALTAAAALLALAMPSAHAAETLSTTVRIDLQVEAQNTADLLTPKANLTKVYTFALATGVGINQADQIWTDTRTVATGTADSIDLKGTLTDHLGVAFTPAKLKMIIVIPAAGNTTILTVGGDTNGVPIFSDKTDSIPLAAGGALLIGRRDLAAIPVTAGTGDILLITNAAGASATYDIILVGTSS